MLVPCLYYAYLSGHPSPSYCGYPDGGVNESARAYPQTNAETVLSRVSRLATLTCPLQRLSERLLCVALDRKAIEAGSMCKEGVQLDTSQHRSRLQKTVWGSNNICLFSPAG